LQNLVLGIMGGATPIVSVLVGDEAATLRAGKFLFDRGYYVQSVLFPAVPYHCGVLRVQCNANHSQASIEGLLAAFAALAEETDIMAAAELMSLAATQNGHAVNGNTSHGDAPK
jgi:glycine C-acetyltransferase